MTTTKDQETVIALIEEQQKGLPNYSPARMAGEQLKGIVMADPGTAELLAQDLRRPGMGIQDAEKKIRIRADAIHKKERGQAVAIPPWEAEDILREFYGLPERTWGPGKSGDGGRWICRQVAGAAGDEKCAENDARRCGDEGKKQQNVLDLADFF